MLSFNTNSLQVEINYHDINRKHFITGTIRYLYGIHFAI